MGNTVRASVYVLSAALIGGRSVTALERASDFPVRTADPTLAIAVRDGIRQSATFQRLAQQIATLKGIVYLEPGRCYESMRSCMFLDVVSAGSFRMLFVRVDPLQEPLAVTESVAHELQHAVEVLQAPDVRTRVAMTSFYRRYGRRISGHFETDEALKVAETVRTELRARVGEPPTDAQNPLPSQ